MKKVKKEIIDDTLLNFKKSDIFTPENISKIMAGFLKENGNLLEPAVGDGQLLKFINFDKYDNIDIFDIKEEYLERCPKHKKIKKHFNDFIKCEITKKYDNIILNPPYIRIQDLSPEYRDFLKKKWEILSDGNIDFYYAFILKSIELLSDDGIMIAITPNSYIYNKSAVELRKYLMENKYIQQIIDFKSQKVFPNISTYCCITIFSKQQKNSLIYNDKIIDYSNLTDSFFEKKNTSGKLLKELCSIKNGIATLRDKIYIHKEKKYDEECWKIITNSSSDLWVIFPYDDNGKIIDEEKFKKTNPKTYEFLEQNREELEKRDKGNKTYASWYAFGRTQSLIKPKAEKVLYISTFVNPKNIKYKIDIPKLFVSSLCIEPKEDVDINDIVEILRNNEDYIEENSSKRGGGWISLSGSILKNIPI